MSCMPRPEVNNSLYAASATDTLLCCSVDHGKRIVAGLKLQLSLNEEIYSLLPGESGETFKLHRKMCAYK